LLTGNHIYAPNSPHYADNRPAGFGSGDTAAAAAALEQAGYVKGSDGIYAKGGKKLEIDYIAQPEDQVGQQVAVILQDTLKKAGIALKVRNVPSADWFATLGKAEYDMNLGNYPASAFPVSWYGGLYPCEAGYNFARYCNDKVTADYYRAYGTLDAKAQADLINAVDKQLWSDVANIPMWVVPQLVIHSNAIEGVRSGLPKEYQLLDASRWTAAG
jgi:peptide/nickel transport system substrate-binding protein